MRLSILFLVASFFVLVPKTTASMTSLRNTVSRRVSSENKSRRKALKQHAHLRNGRYLSAVAIARPPKPEQRSIAAALSDVDGLVGGLDRLIAKKRDLKQAAMQQLLTGQTRLPGFHGEWDVKRLGEVTDTDPENLGSDTRPDLAFNYISLEDVDQGTLRGHSEQVFRSAPSRARRKLRDNDVLVSTVRPNLKSHLLFRHNGQPWVCSTGFCVVRCREKVTHPSYVFFHMFGHPVAWQIEALLTGSNYPAINSGDVRALEIPFPDFAEQTAIAEVLTEMDAELAALEQRREKTRALKQAMMQELLTGKIRLVPPQVTVAEKPAHNWQINEAVIIGVLAGQFGTEAWPLPRKRRVKLTYLLHRHAEGKAEGYLKKAAGPYNPKTKYQGPEGIAFNNGYVREHNNGKYEGLIAGGKIAQAEQYFAEWYPGGKDWVEQFRFRKTDELEVLATVDMAIEDLKSSNRAVSLKGVKEVVRAHPEWEAKLSRSAFSDANIAEAMSKCNELFMSSTPDI
jgi:type I restriction enzyme S subunit